MKLSMSLLAKHLAKYDPEIHISTDTLSIKGIRFLSDQRTSYALDYVYLGEAYGYIQDPRYRDAVILVSGENEIICHSNDSEALINDILAAFDYYGGFEEKLLVAAAEHQSLEIMLEAAAGIIDSPILVFDMEGALIRALRSELLPEPIGKSVREHSMLDLKSSSQLFQDEYGKIWHDITDYPALLHPVDNPTEKAVSMYLNYENERVGFMMIFPVSENEERLSIYCEGLFGEYFCKASEFTDRSSIHLASHQIFKQSLAGEVLSEVAVNRLEKEILADPYRILLVMQSYGTRNYTIHHLLINEIKALGLKCAACEYQDTVAVLINKTVEKDILALLQQKQWIHNLCVGISMPVHDMQKLKIAYDQAYFAMHGDANPGIRRCADYALPFLLQILRKNELASHLRHPAVSILQSYDEANHTELLHTLETYLRNSCSQNLTAEALHIHLNSLKYRLRRIEELTEIRFKDAEEIFYLELSLML